MGLTSAFVSENGHSRDSGLESLMDNDRDPTSDLDCFPTHVMEDKWAQVADSLVAAQERTFCANPSHRGLPDHSSRESSPRWPGVMN